MSAETGGIAGRLLASLPTAPALSMGIAAGLAGINEAARRMAEQQQAEVRLAALALQGSSGDLLGRARAEVTRRTPVLDSRLAALQSVYDDLAAGRMR